MKNFGAKVYLINPKAQESEVHDYRVYHSIEEVPEPIDLAVLRTPPKATVDILRACGEFGIRSALITSDGFGEGGAEGVELERQLAIISAETGIRVLGPNTNDNAFERFPDKEHEIGGRIGLVTQSGAMGRSIVQGARMGARFSRWIPTGNEVDIDAADIIEYFAHDPDTSVIAGYIEGFRSGTKLRRALHAAMTAGKPVVLLKVGSTAAGARVATSHTGHLTGSDEVIEGLFKQYGVTRVRDLDELLETANLFAKLPADCGVHTAIYSASSGGGAAVMTELAELNGVPTPNFTADTVNRLAGYFPDNMMLRNPIEGGNAFALRSTPEVRLQVLDAVAADANTDLVVFGTAGVLPIQTDTLCAEIGMWSRQGKKPVVACWASLITDCEGYRSLVKNGVAVFHSYRNAFNALAHRRNYIERKANYAWRGEVQSSVIGENRIVVGPETSANLLARHGIPMVREAIVGNGSEARAVAQEFGGPVVMKLVSKDFPHKTEYGLVKLGVVGAEAVASAYDDLVSRALHFNPSASIDGVSIQEFLSGGVELLIGITHDPVVGHALTIGAGGIYTEVLKDVAVRPLPVSKQDVVEMLASLRITKILDGARGQQPADKNAVIEVALQVAEFALLNADTVVEMDLNPVVALPAGARVVDSLLVVENDRLSAAAAATAIFA